jgi:hypothetical protein
MPRHNWPQSLQHDQATSIRARSNRKQRPNSEGARWPAAGSPLFPGSRPARREGTGFDCSRPSPARWSLPSRFGGDGRRSYSPTPHRPKSERSEYAFRAGQIPHTPREHHPPGLVALDAWAVATAATEAPLFSQVGLDLPAKTDRPAAQVGHRGGTVRVVPFTARQGGPRDSTAQSGRRLTRDERDATAPMVVLAW